MAIRSLCNALKPPLTVESTLYTAQTNTPGVMITKFVAHNDTGPAAAYTVKIYSANGNPVSSIAPYRVVNPYKADIPPELSGVVIPPGGSIKVTTTVPNVLAFTVAGDS